MLVDYTCTRCFTHPFDEKELFFGCNICGNTNFKVEPTLEQKIAYFRSKVNTDRIFENIESVKILESGSYHVDVDKLFKDSRVNLFPSNLP